MLVGNHIGNHLDLSPRAVEALRSADTIIYEYADKFEILLEALDISVTDNLITFAESDLPPVRARIVDDLASNKLVVMIADNGYPMIADPGLDLVEFLLSNGIEFDIIPGPSISSTANVIAAIPRSSGDYIFQEFFGHSSDDIVDSVKAIRDLPHSLVFVDLPHRLPETLATLRNVLGNRWATLCVDITTKTSSIVRGTIQDLEDYINSRSSLDIAATIVVSGKR